MQFRIFLSLTLIALLTACAPTTEASSPIPTLPPVSPSEPLPGSATNSPIPEIISPTPETIPTTAATYTIEPTITETLLPHPTLDLLPTMVATSIPQPSVGSGAIQFYGPGPLSKLASKVAVYGYAIPGFDRKGTVDLYGEDGRLLASELLQLNTAYTWAYFYWNLPFEVPAAGELGRLTMSTKDQYGRLKAVYSVHLILLAEGYSIVYPPGDLRERLVMEQPAAGKRIAGGNLSVEGAMRPFNSLPLVVELIDQEGNIIASQLAPVSPAPDDSYVPFQADLSYSISSGTWAQLAVRQADDRIAGTMYLYSRDVYLNP